MCIRDRLATGGLGLWLDMGVSVWRSLQHIGCLWSAFQAFPAAPLVHALINVGGGMYVPYPTLWYGQWSVWRQRPRKLRYYLNCVSVSFDLPWTIIYKSMQLVAVANIKEAKERNSKGHWTTWTLYCPCEIEIGRGVGWPHPYYCKNGMVVLTHH